MCLTPKTLGLQLKMRAEHTAVLRFKKDPNGGEISEGMLKRLPKTIKSFKKLRKIDIQCDE